MKKTAKRGKGGTSFVSVVKAALDKGITNGEEIIKIAKKELPGIDEKKLRARVNATIKYLGKKPAKKVKVEKPVKETKKVVKEEKNVEVTPKPEIPVVVPETTVAPVNKPETSAVEIKEEEGIGDIVIQ